MKCKSVWDKYSAKSEKPVPDKGNRDKGNVIRSTLETMKIVYEAMANGGGREIVRTMGRFGGERHLYQ